MKSSEKKQKPCNCGSREFITAPNSYNIYELIDEKLEFIRSEIIEDEIKFYCRECGERYVIQK